MNVLIAGAALSIALTTTGLILPPATRLQSDEIRNNQWHLAYLRVGEAHKITKGAGVTVAVIDTGVEPHPDLRNNLLPGTDITRGGNNSGTKDRDGHGTSMAGLIAAHGRSQSSGALGVAPEAKILPIYALPGDTPGDPDKIAEGIRWAVKNRATVINISTGGGSTPKLAKAVAEAASAEVVIIAASGNAPGDFGVTFPAALEDVVAVGAVDKSGNHSGVSVTGRELQIVAPGNDIYSTSHKGKYSLGTGTSAATAIVAGAAALVRSKYPHLPAQEVVHRLTATAVDKGAPGRDEEYGYGVLDIVAALTADVPPLGFESPGASGATTPNATATAAGPAGDETPGWRLPLLTLGVLGVAGLTGLLWWRQRRHAVG
ncbi:type VII secretion-associated serine protease mycosin [Micromonospora echinofusca]|uniref:Type VII secretion-associated serine protease mycosin n=1 Tax=Micromonospora echinofusca TaxID=47858 RepID=A0ABS3VPM1_MICEH|nr:type VII secretion-associated serine protease mycosin [Micromonospora echinofusca]MBO4206506.1 type VII secretion-associated serine protease mycosin [Micromonospora echinofusca]